MYYIAFFDSEDSNLYRSVIDILYRGITAEAQPVTLVFATLILPMTTLATLFLPSIIYVLILHIKKSKKALTIVEHAMLIVYPIFTNLFYIKSHETQAIIEQISLRKRPESAPGLNSYLEPPTLTYTPLTPSTLYTPSTPSTPFRLSTVSTPSSPSRTSTPFASPKLKPRSKSLPTMSINDKVLDQPNFSLFHSNILYTFFFVSTSLILGADTTLQFIRNGRIATVTMYFAAVFLVNLVLWLDFNYSRTKKEEPARPRSWLLELMEEDTLASLVVAPLLWMLQRISCCQNNAPTSAGGQDVVVEGGESMMDLDTVSAVRSLAGGSARLLRQAPPPGRGGTQAQEAFLQGL